MKDHTPMEDGARWIGVFLAVLLVVFVVYLMFPA